MINNRELRLGNWVNDYLNNPVQIEALHFEVTPQVSPIELSPELLERCGFKYGQAEGITSFEEGESDPDGLTHYWDFDIKRTEFVDSHSISIVKWGEQEYFTFQMGRGTYRQLIKYLHQLQNLIFCLTGNEITLKENPLTLKQ